MIESILICTTRTSRPDVPIEESIGEMARLVEEGKATHWDIEAFVND